MRVAGHLVRSSLVTACLTLSLFALGCEQQLPSEPDIGREVEPIIGGQIDNGDPAVALIVYADNSGAFTCTGTLISPTAILTAGHCVVRNAECNSPWDSSACSAAPADGFVILGGTRPIDDDWNLDAPAWRAFVTGVHPHPQYGTDNSGAPEHDVAILNIGEIEVFTGSAPQPSAWLSTTNNAAVSGVFKAVGYGITSAATGAGTGTKRMVNLTIAGRDASTFWYSGQGQNTCSGDSGGPAFKTIGGVQTLIGTTSYGDQNCTQTGVNMRVDYESAFISQWLGDTNPGQEPTGWSGSANPNLATADNGQVCTSLTVSGTGNAADARIDLSGSHDWRSILRATLAHGGTTKEVFPVGTFPDNAGAFSLTSTAIGGFTGSAAGTWTLCIVDTDAYGDSGVLSSWSVHD